MVVCAACSAENREGARFCDACAAPLSPAAEVHGQRKTVTVVFCDVVGSTALGESQDPEALQVLLARYFERMKGIVEQHGGTVEKFIGDAVMAVFGVPVLHEDDAVRALRAAVEMRDALPELGVEGRIGVDTGEVVTGTEERLATGDAVNVAARLQQAAASGEILFGAQTMALAGEAVEAEELAPLELKGKREPVTAYLLMAVHETPEREHGMRFVGRTKEVSFLRDAWQRAVEGSRCELVTITGEAGVGKSRLVAELVDGLGVRVVRGRCLSYGEGISYWPVVEVIKQLDTLPADRAVEAAIGSLLGESNAATSAEEIAWAFRKLLEQTAPLLVVFDDIQWGEETFLDLVEHVALLSSGAPLFLLCVARPELAERRPQWPIALKLEPLPPADVEALLPQTISPELRERISRAAGGNPLFVTEMVAMAAEAGEQVTVPPTLKALLAARLDQLEAPERNVLERGAVEGEVFHRGAVQALAPGGQQVTPRLAALVRKELIRPERPILPAEDGFRFCHLLIRDAAYDALPKATRAELHERFADWLDKHGGALVERDELVGYHLEQAHRYRTELGHTEDETRALGERAAALFVAAARRAAARGDYHAVANLLERALELGIADARERVRMQLELAVALGAIWRRTEADALNAAVVEAATALGERGVAAAALVSTVARFGDPELDLDDVLAVCAQAIDTLTELGDERGLARVRNTLAVALQRTGRAAAAGAMLEHALADAEACGDRELRRWAANALANMYLPHGPTPVGEAIGRCEALLRSTQSDRVLEAEIKRSLGLLYAMAARPEEALGLIRQSGLVLDELNQSRLELYRGEVAYAKELAGDRAGAEQELETMWRRFNEERGGRTEMRALRAASELARLYCDEGRWDEAAGAFAYGRDAPLANDSRGTAARRLAVEARLAARDSRLAEAVTLAERAVAHADARGDELNTRAIVWVALAEVQRANGETAKAEISLATALALYERKGNIAAARAASSASY